jgi:hypothetical protein
LSRHRKVQFSRSKALVIAAAGAFSVVTAISATRTLALPTAEAADQQVSANSVRDAYQVRLAETRDAIAQWQAARQQAAPKAVTATTTATLIPTQSRTPAAAQPARTATVAAPAASGSAQQIAEAMIGSFGWSSSQFSCLDPLWQHESGWSATAYNAGSGAYGIPQALPGAKIAGAGPDWQTNAATQIKWGLEYIRGLYGSPCGAWAHEQATGWY